MSAAPRHTAIAERRIHFKNKGDAVFESFLFEIEISWALVSSTYCTGEIPEAHTADTVQQMYVRTRERKRGKTSQSKYSFIQKAQHVISPAAGSSQSKQKITGSLL